MLAHAGAPRLARWVHRDALLVLTYHNVIPNGGHATRGEASLHVEQAQFGEQLDVLRETHDVVSIIDVLNGRRASGDRPRALITFDDAYSGAVTLAVEELAKRRLEATIFVAPACIGRAFWWDALAGGTGGELPSSVRNCALFAYGGDENRVRQWADASGMTMTQPHDAQRCATLLELRAASRIPGITFASHSWSHPVLATLHTDELSQELGRSLRWLRDTLGSIVPALAVPYALSCPAVEIEARRQGYAAVFPGNRGWVSSRGPLPFALPRQNVPAGLSLNTFRLRISGVPT